MLIAFTLKLWLAWCRAMGVLVFFMLCGYYPFDDESIPVMFRNIKKGK
jgi:hypothetical protein